MGLPTVSITFKPRTAEASDRAERGVLAIVVQDTTKTDYTSKAYGAAAEVDSADYTAANLKVIKSAFIAAPNKVIVVRVGSSDAFTKAEPILDKLGYDWVCSPVATFQSAIVTYVKKVNTEARARNAKCIVTGATSANDEHVVNFVNTNVTIAGESAVTAAVNYLPRLAGVLAACPLDRSVTGYALNDLTAITEAENIDTAIDGGGFAIYKDDDTFRIARGVNTLQTVGGDSGKTEDMKKIAVVEGMDYTKQEIVTIFKKNYLGKKKNDANNQAVLLADILGIFGKLVSDGAIDGEEEVSVAIDVPAMRKAWVDAGVDVSGLSDAQVKAKTYGSKVFLMASGLRFLDAMEDLNMAIRLG